jgi:gliding motility-associated-like protein
MPSAPSYINLDYVSVVDERTVEIAFSADISENINDFQVSRGELPKGSFVPFITLQDVFEPTVTINDDVLTHAEQFYYKIEALNSCMAPISSSNTGNNIVLQGYAERSLINLSWTPYVEFTSGIKEYRIFRKNQEGEYEAISSISPEEQNFIEDISIFGDNKMQGQIEYFIEAHESGTNPLGISGVSRSNEIKVYLETEIYMPNAFTPDGDGQNDIFAPVFSFEPKEYKMFIFERTGKMLFHTTDPKVGWDGSMNGSGKAPEAVYVYHVESKSHYGVRQVQTGNVTLIYP